MSRTRKVACGRFLLSSVLVASAFIGGCGGGGGGDSITPVFPPPASSSSVTGTAASGAPMANVVVTLKDSTNRSASATTGANGAFTLDSSGLTPPFVLQAALPGGSQLFSVSTDANRTATINITPLTDIVVRAWYGMQGRAAADGFANPVAAPPPGPAQVRSISQVLVSDMQLAFSAHAVAIADPTDLIAKPFKADGTGMDKVLDNTRVTVRGNGADLVVTAGTATQSTALGYSTATSAITASSTTVDGSKTTTSQATDVVPVQGSQQAALDQIAASVASVAASINAKGSALKVADLEPFFDAGLLHRGRSRAQFLAETVSDFQGGGTVAMTVERVRSLDLAAGKAEVVMRLALSLNGQSEVERDSFFFLRGSDGTWRFAGDGRVAQVSVQAEGRANQGLFTGDNGPAINIDVRAPKASITAATASGGGSTLPLQRGATEVLPSGLQLDAFFANTGPIATVPLPVAGLPVTVALTTAASGTVSYVVPLNAFTTELVRITSPTGTAISAGPVTVTWTLPTTYVVQRTQLSAQLFTGDQNLSSTLECTLDDAVVSPSATSGTLTLPATCSGLPVRLVNLNLATNGVNGERSMVVYALSMR